LYFVPFVLINFANHLELQIHLSTFTLTLAIYVVIITNLLSLNFFPIFKTQLYFLIANQPPFKFVLVSSRFPHLRECVTSHIHPLDIQ